jgi:hypothetical protein
MEQIPLDSVPNQQVSFNLNGAYWQLKLYESINFMCADISINGTPVINGVRCFGGVGLLPYGYMTQPDLGNLVFDSDADWSQFGSTCNLYHLESSEYQSFQLLLLLGN